MVVLLAAFCLAASFAFGRATVATSRGGVVSAPLTRERHLGLRQPRDAADGALSLASGDPHGGHHADDGQHHDGHDRPPESIQQAHGHDDSSAVHWKCDADGHCEKEHPHATHSASISVAVGLIATVVMVPLVLYMALTDWLVAELTFKMVDTFVSIFLAILWFNAFNQLMDTTGAGRVWPHAKEIVSLATVLGLYGIALLIALHWRDETMKMTTFCTCGAHYIAFAGIAAAGTLQEGISEAIGAVVGSSSAEPFMSFGFCFIVIAFIGAISFMNWIAWRKGLEHEKLNHSIEEMELDMTGLIASFLITQAVRHALTGQYPALGHFFLFFQGGPGHDSGHGKSHVDQLSGGDVGPAPEIVDQALDHVIGHGHHVKHEAWQRAFMLGWAVSLTVLAGVLLPWLSRRQHVWIRGERAKWIKRGVRLVKVVMIMLVAWGYLLWAQWEFFENLFVGDQMFGHMVFAVGATLTSLAILYVLALVQGKVQSPEARESNTITMTGISLVTAWSWEHCFNVAFDVIGQEFEVGYGGLVPKLVMAFGIPCVMLPTYVKHVRTRVMQFEHEQEKEEQKIAEEHIAALKTEADMAQSQRHQHRLQTSPC